MYNLSSDGGNQSPFGKYCEQQNIFNGTEHKEKALAVLRKRLRETVDETEQFLNSLPEEERLTLLCILYSRLLATVSKESAILRFVHDEPSGLPLF